MLPSVSGGQEITQDYNYLVRRRVDLAIIPAMNTVPHLLIVDDDKETCALLSKFLVRHGYRVSVAHDSKTMGQVLDAARINLMILDLMLPGEDGLAICRRLRAASTL